MRIRGHGLLLAAWPRAWASCGGDTRPIAFITEPGPIRTILTQLGEPLEPPPVSPARGPPTRSEMVERVPLAALSCTLTPPGPVATRPPASDRRW
jgi:hypothetical protein